MQKNLKLIQKANLQVVAVSYDSVKVLREFGQRGRILFPLLSDPDSKTIDAYGIRNKEMKGKRFDGIPYPGTFLIDSSGVIRDKLFFEDYSKRHQAKDILKASAKLSEPKKKAS